MRDIELTFSKITLYLLVIFLIISGLMGAVLFGHSSLLGYTACAGVFGSVLLILVGVGLYYKKNWAFYGGTFLLAFRLAYSWADVVAYGLFSRFLFDAFLNSCAMVLLVLSYREFTPLLQPPRGSDLGFNDIRDLKCERCGSEKLYIPVENIAECQSCGNEFSFERPKDG